jgi:uncharacterized oxidoreductase
MDPTAHPSVAEAVGVAATVLESVGAPTPAARSIAESLVQAERMGHASHGLIRVLEYRASALDAQIVAAAVPVVERRSGGTAVIDGQWGWGHLTARLASDVAIELAEANGVGMVGARACNHSGRLGEWVERIAAHGLVGIGWLSCGPAVAAPGGTSRTLGTNPLAIAVPTGDDSMPVVLDFATAGYAEGKVRVAAHDGKQLPPGVLQTKDGDPTTDPHDFYLGGALLPFGGHKGYGLSVMIQILGDALCGTGPQRGRELMSNHLLLIAVSPGRLQSIPVFHEVVGQVQQRIRSTAPDGSPEAVLLPGDVEARTVASQLPDHVAVSGVVWSELGKLVQEGHGAT